MVVNLRAGNAHDGPITDDKESFFILSWLHRNGRQTVEELSTLTRLSLPQVRVKIRKLFQSSLCTIGKEDTVAVSEYGRQMLSRLGMSRIAAESLIRDANLTAWETDFLIAWLRFKADDQTPDNHLRMSWYLDAVKSATAVVEMGQRRQWFSTRNRARSCVYFAMTVGMDPHFGENLTSEYYDAIMRHYWLSEDERARYQLHEMGNYKARIQQSCRQARKYVIKCNVVLQGRATLGTSRPSSVSNLVALARLFLALLSDVPDPELLAAYWQDSVLPNNLWEHLSRVYPDIDDMIRQVLLRWSQGSKAEAQLERGVANALRAVLDRGRSMSDLVLTAQLAQPTSPFAQQMDVPRLGNWTDSVVGDLRSARMALEAGQLVEATSEESNEIRDEAKLLLDTLRTQLNLD